MLESMFQQLATTSTRTIPLPKWRSTSKEWPLEMVCVTLNWWIKIIFPFFKCIKCQIILIHQSAIALNWLSSQMLGGYADFLYQTGLVDELQRQHVQMQTDAVVKLIQEQRWVEAFQVSVINQDTGASLLHLFWKHLISRLGFWQLAEWWSYSLSLILPKRHWLHQLLQLHAVSGTHTFHYKQMDGNKVLI